MVKAEVTKAATTAFYCAVQQLREGLLRLEEASGKVISVKFQLNRCQAPPLPPFMLNPSG